jgi:hypothetical protein
MARRLDVDHLHGVAHLPAPGAAGLLETGRRQRRRQRLRGNALNHLADLTHYRYPAG